MSCLPSIWEDKRSTAPAGWKLQSVEDRVRIAKKKPFPRTRRKLGRWAEMALRMEVGDSVRLDTEIKAQTLVRVLRRYKMRGSQRVQGDDTFRVWRTR